MFNRSAGILLPISSLPSNYGIGTFGRAAYEFVDFLNKSGQKYWQVLPLGPVSYGDSPYSPFSIYAGNPYYIDLDILIEDSILSKEELKSLDCCYYDEKSIDYENLFYTRFKVLKKAYYNANKKYKEEISSFVKSNNWVCEYALFMSLKYKNNQLPWSDWDKLESELNSNTISLVKIELKEDIDFWIFLQYLFYKQYFNLKEYANGKGIKIIGDIPIYAAEDSADVWASSNVFLMDHNKIPIKVAGVPPDAFSSEGQLWGNPVYNWEYLKGTSYRWWCDRIIWTLKLYDVVRLDHFRGFDEFWGVNYGSPNAVNGLWMPAYGYELFKKLKLYFEDVKIIAEDLGIITDSVVKLRNNYKFPGMKIFQFAFDGNKNNPYLPNNYEDNSVAYTGTHDNDTLLGWYDNLNDSEKKDVLNYLDTKKDDNINYKIINSLYMSKSNLCIIPLQDFLCIGSEARINTPSTVGGNWVWRVKKETLTDELSEKINNMVNKSKRI
ncbi:4-alpha-glucanotransferase [Sedimentibacter acidaminivorans]|uniref:4-alpha-glucanotransferase n=1 Tax=Sedimentibacter acidaminivorans TaxID=913099 RepID=A0ABS4GFJ2_9FIRM|nr:4-alpha-glucanotransferase [Sedimentibacter acidaminivorans]MBP1926449.1 4-alpha-glucanotransferase [Sedimentibacter acidaminivorans]